MIKKVSGVLAGAGISLAVGGCSLASTPLPIETKLAPATSEIATQLPVGDLQTVYINVTKTGYEPSVVSIPQGVRVRVVLVNRDDVEHHFHVADMEAGAAMWLVKDPGVHAGHAAHSAGAVSNSPATYSATHPCNHYCVTGICYTKDKLHAFAAPHDTDEVIFTPLEKGEFLADDPLSDLKATIQVY